MGKACYGTSSFLKRAVPRNAGSCSEGLFAFPCVGDCSPVILSGRGWGFIRLTFLSQRKILRAGAAATRAPSSGTAPGSGTGAPGAQEQWDPDRIPVAALSELCSQGKRVWEICTLSCPSHRPHSAGTALRHLTFAWSLCKAAQALGM